MEWQAWAFLGVVLAIAISTPLIARLLREHKIRRAGLGDLAQMTDEAMVAHLERLFGAMGFSVSQTDGVCAEFDLILRDGLGHQRVVLARDWRRPVDEFAVARAATATATLEDTSAILFTAEYCTYMARKEAERTGTLLWSLRELADAIEQVKRRSVEYPDLPTLSDLGRPKGKAADQGPEPERERAVPLHSRPASAKVEAPPNCPRCGRRMIIRKNSRKTYWACGSYPRCLGVRAVEE